MGLAALLLQGACGISRAFSTNKEKNIFESRNFIFLPGFVDFSVSISQPTVGVSLNPCFITKLNKENNFLLMSVIGRSKPKGDLVFLVCIKLFFIKNVCTHTHRGTQTVE